MAFPLPALPSQDLNHATEQAGELLGVQSAYWDIWGREHRPDPAIQRAILAAHSIPTDSAAALDDAIRRRVHTSHLAILPPSTVTTPADPFVSLCLPQPSEPAAWQLILEDGSPLTGLCPASPTETIHFDGAAYDLVPLRLPDSLAYGYHRLTVHCAGRQATTHLIHCPPAAPALAPRQRLSGIAVSLYGLRSQRNWGVGDTTDLAAFVSWAHTEAGAAFVALNPLHAIGNRLPYNASPYLPNCTFYRNFLYIDIEAVPGFTVSPVCRRLLARYAPQIEALRHAPLVQYEAVARLKLRFLKQLYREFRLQPGPSAFHQYVAAEGELLRRYALYCALDETLHKQNPAVWIWPQWPAELQDPDSPAVAAFAAAHPRLLEFYSWLAWLVDDQLARVHRHAKAIGMPIGLYHDLALATDRCGSDLWAHRPFYMQGCRVGAPPDGFAPQGQDWGFPPPNALRHEQDGFRLFAAAIRNNCRHGGALRMDHVMRFFRLYWIPADRDATGGTYVKEHWQPLLRIIALEAHRAGVLVIGEDLGTVEDYVRQALAECHILSYRLLYFERHPGGAFKLPADYPPLAIVSSTTHDLPTLAGFWTGRDIEARRAAALIDEAGYRAQWTSREQDKQHLLHALHHLQLLPPGYPEDIRHVPELSGELHNAIIGFLAATPAQLLVLNQEDLTKETEQQNLPGATWQYPNWQRKMRYTLEELSADPRVHDFTRMYRGWLERSGRI
ncbi:MAG: 4-alpha-glucanotransferase [Acidobacteriota bacterium]